jgi:chromate reductase, NAD(P)H dehydrogenase (quinone)
MHGSALQNWSCCDLSWLRTGITGLYCAKLDFARDKQLWIFGSITPVMAGKKTIAAICGSTKRSSINLSLIKAIAELTSADFDFTIFTGITGIPHFNPDLEGETTPVEVTTFRDMLRKSDAILICTPEYAMGVPGSLKNAIDWTVSSCEFSHKPVALITASSMGYKGHQSLLETLKIIESDITDETQLVIPFVKTKVSGDGKITDAETLSKVKSVMDALKQRIA